MTKTYSIEDIAHECKVSPEIIRFWEIRYEAFSPERSPSGVRLYTEDDLLRARLIIGLVEQGFGVKKIAPFSQEKMETLLKESFEHTGKRSFNRLFMAIKNFEIGNISNCLDQLALGLDAKEFIFTVVLPTIDYVELLIYRGELALAKAENITTLIRFQLNRFKFSKPADGEGQVLLCTPIGSRSEFIISVANTLCQANGLGTNYLGTSCSAQFLASSLTCMDCRTILIGSATSGEWDYKKQMVPYLMELDKLLKYQVKIVLGGEGILRFPRFEMISEIGFIRNFYSFDDEIIANKFLYAI